MEAFLNDPAVVWVLIPVSAIVLGIGSGILKMIMNHQETMAQIRTAKQQVVNAPSNSEIALLRAEVERLRDTSTQFDMSIDHQLKDLDLRLKSLEGSRSTYVPPVQPAEETVQVTR